MFKKGTVVYMAQVLEHLDHLEKAGIGVLKGWSAWVSVNPTGIRSILAS